MIFVITGTQNYNFDRLINSLLKIKINQQIIIQSNSINFPIEKENIKVYTELKKDKYKKIINEAQLIITHGGIGSIFDCLNKNKKVIAIPRLSKFKEHIDDHQIEIVEKFVQMKYLKTSNLKNLQKDIEDTIKWVPKKYKNDSKNNLINYLEKILID